MVRQKWAKPLAKAALLIISGAGAIYCACAQQGAAGGSLEGKLTDIHSAPLENVTVILRNAATGAEVKTTTAHGGRYSFANLVKGEYALTAIGPGGTGQVDGIFVASGHEAHIQTALEFKAGHQTLAVHGEDVEAPSAVIESAAIRLRALQTSPPFTPGAGDLTAKTAAISLQAQPLLVLSLGGGGVVPMAPTLPLSSVSTSIEPISSVAGLPSGRSADLALLKFPGVANPVFLGCSEVSVPSMDFAARDLAAAILEVELSAEQASLLGIRVSQTAQIAVLRSTSIPQSPQSLNSTQLQALPLPGRDWQSFLRDAPEQGSGDQQKSGPAGSATEATVDGIRTQPAFGNGENATRSGAFTLMSPASGDTAIREVQVVGEGSASIPGVLGGVNIETQSGTERLHGQAFVFDRQNLWGARNPFTQWTQESSPASATTIPQFTAEPYSPDNHEALWGAGMGGVFRKPRLFWFVALDGYERNDPAVASVKHSDNFFAQPSNDRMQLLSAQLGLNGADPVSAGTGAYSKLLESLAGLLGPAPRSASQFTGFARIDWSVDERNRVTLEATGTRLDAPGGGFTRASATYGTHSFGVVNSAAQWMLGKWETFLTPNLLAVTQGSYGHHVHTTAPETPSAYEQSLNINAWGQLPQIVVDSRYGFTIGNPARLGRGSYPDEHLYMAQEQLNWVRGNLVMKAGFEISHNADATTQLRNQTGTYHYASVENFASDALAFAAFGVTGQLNPMDQHNCDQTGRAWRDSSGVLHGLGYLPCYSYYSQTMGPSDWWLSTNDWAGYVTSQWQPTKRLTLTLAMRWELQQLPASILTLQNPDLPLTGHMPDLGSQWGPRVGLAWGASESRWPVVRFGYGMYFGRTSNSVLETALTQTGSLKGDLNFFMRPTDNLSAGGAPPFPYVLAGEPARVVKPGAVEFAPNFRNGEIHQAEASIQEIAPGRVQVEASAIMSLGRRLPVTFDANIDPSIGSQTITYSVIDGNGSGPIKSTLITVPFFASWPSSTSPTGFTGRLNSNYQQVNEIYSRANSTYEAAMLRISRSARGLTLRGRYTYAHAMDWNPDETSQVGPSVFDPIDFRQEYGTSNLDVRHSVTAAVIVQSRWKLSSLAGYFANNWMLSGTGYFRSGLPYTMRTAGSLAKEFTTSGTAIVALSSGMNGYGGDNRVYGIGRNTYRYPSIWKADLRLSKRFELGQMRQLELIAESFNLFNHQNVTELETTGYLIEPGTTNGGLPRFDFLTGLKTGQTEFGTPMNVNAVDFYRERQIQFGARVRF